MKVEEIKAVCTQDLVTLQRALMPSTSEDQIQQFTDDLLSGAIALRNAMTSEQAIYRCYFVGVGTLFDRKIAQINPGERTEGTVLLCVFPGLVRKHIGDIECKESRPTPSIVRDIQVSKAVVKLDSAFPRKSVGVADPPPQPWRKSRTLDESAATAHECVQQDSKEKQEIV
jgi:hypothetical protein